MYMYPTGIPVYPHPIHPDNHLLFHSWSRTGISSTAVQFMNVMRMLWEQHVAWTRMTIISIAEGLADEEQTTKRLLRNVPDMAAVFRLFYGNQVAARFETLFLEHLVLAAQLVHAAKAGDNAQVAELNKKWYANADQLAKFFSSINPYWPENEMKKMLYEHLDMTKAEAIYRLHKDYASDIAAYDRIEQQALAMADMFAHGFMKQFPYAFSA
ncbi:hypothetical protein [Paenibacillus arenosi]|nr:hypothetical protein [Paenibacillus arenosi]